MPSNCSFVLHSHVSFAAPFQNLLPTFLQVENSK